MTLHLHHLSPRRREVAEMVGDGKSYRQISASLDINVKTARVHVSQIADKIGRDGTSPYVFVMRWVLTERSKAA